MNGHRPGVFAWITTAWGWDVGSLVGAMTTLGALFGALCAYLRISHGVKLRNIEDTQDKILARLEGIDKRIGKIELRYQIEDEVRATVSRRLEQLEGVD